MKNRIYKIKDKILVRGNENELTKYEVLVKEENGSVVLKERVNGEVKSIAGGSSTSNFTLDVSQGGGESSIESTLYFFPEIAVANFTDKIVLALTMDGDTLPIELLKTNEYEYDGNLEYVYQGSFFISGSVSVVNFLFSTQPNSSKMLAYVLLGNLVG